MARSAASYILMLDEQSSQAQNVLHKNAFSDEALFRFTPQYEASSFHSDMKHFAYAPYDLSSIALCATDDEKMKNESCVCKYSLPMLHYSVERKNLMEKTSNKLVDLSVAFAVEILNLVKYLKEQRETIICNQIGRAGTSIGAINERLAYIADHIPEQPEVRIKYFVPDEHKSGGAIIEFSGKVKKISATDGTIVMADGCKIRLSDIVDLSF